MKAFDEFTNWFDGVIWSVPLFFLLLGCGLLFSIVTKVVQWRALTHGIQCVRGKYDRPDDTGHISHFQALCAALSATIGLGNIAGVATAITIGGPGAVFWMWVVGFFGMALKFVECSLAVMFRDKRDVPDATALQRAHGEVRGGPMWYIQKAMVEPLRARGHPAWILFKAFAVIYAVVIAVASFGGGNMYQSWNVGNTVNTTFGLDQRITGAIVAFLVSLVIIGGIRRIGAVAGKLVPFMCVVYVLGALAVVAQNAALIPDMIAMIFKSAFTQTAGEGAFAGITIYAVFKVGLQRALFSNEAGQGSAAIAHAAAKTEEPVREGAVAAIGPFVDTIIICTMTALVILSTGTWNRPPVGTVAGVEEHVEGSTTVMTVSVQMTPSEQIPENLEAPHYADLADGDVKLWVLVDRPRNGSAPTRLEARAPALEGRSAEELAGLPTFQMILTRAGEENDPEEFAANLAKLEVGQPVHLALDGAEITRFALDTLGVGVGRAIILVGVCLFAFSTMISWSYYGEKGIEYLFGPGAILPYKVLFIIAIFMGCVIQNFETVYHFSDAMVGLTVFCNLPACLILLPMLVRAARKYFDRLDTGNMPHTK